MRERDGKRWKEKIIGICIYMCVCYCKNGCVKMILGIRENFECHDTLEDYVSCV